MYITQYFLFIIIYEILDQNQIYANNIDGQGLFGGYYVSCTSIYCRQRVTIIAGSIVGGGVLLVIVLLLILFCYYRCKGQPSRTNSTFIKRPNNQNELHNGNIFKSGTWSSRYLQYGTWHGFHPFLLAFDSQTFKLTGSGTDDIGMFTIDGVYSVETGRIAFLKSYRFETGDQLKRIECPVIIQVSWNRKRRQFEGKWYIKTKAISSENKFELKFCR